MINQAYIDRLAQVENNTGNPFAKNPNSTAKGRFQFIDSTAKAYGLVGDGFDHRGDLAKETEAVTKFTQDNSNILKKELGRDPTYGELYLAHQQGAGGAAKLLKANPDDKAINVLGLEQVKNNGGDENTTVAEFQEKWTSKFKQLDEKLQPQQTIDFYEYMGAKNQERPASEQSTDFYQFMGVEPQEPEFTLNAQGDREIVNQTVGAPSYVRSIVGSVQKPEDKLNTLRQYYPDAQPYGEDNFIFTDPETNEKKIYNPKGFGQGDVASIAREGAISVGATIGGVLGGGGALIGGQLGPQIATPEEIVTVPLAVSAGSGLGAAIAANTYDGLLNLFGLRKDTRTPQEIAFQTGSEVAIGVIGELGGQVVAKGAQKALQGVSPARRRIMQAFDDLGVTPTLAGVSKNKGMSANIQEGLKSNFFAAPTIEKVAKKQISQINKALNKTLSDLGQAKTMQGAGETVKRAAKKAAERFRFKQEQVYEEVFEQIGPDVRVDVKNIIELKNRLSSEIADAPRSLGKVYDSAIKEMDNIIADASDDIVTRGTGILDIYGEELTQTQKISQAGIPFKALRKIRTSIGQRKNNPGLIDSGSLEQSKLDMIYGALTLDISEAASLAGDDVARKLKVADRGTRIFMNTAAKTLEKIAKYDADERAFKYVLSGSKDGGTSLQRLRRNFTSEEWDTISASTLRKIGQVNESGDFNLKTFLREYKKLAPESKEALLGGTRYKSTRKALDNLEIVLQQLRDVESYANASKTAAATQTLTFFDGLGTFTGSALGLGLEGASGGVSGGLLGGSAVLALRTGAPVAGAKVISSESLARLMTNDVFVNWLTEPMRRGVVDVTKHIAKLSIIAKENVELEEAIQEYYATLENATRGEK